MQVTCICFRALIAEAVAPLSVGERTDFQSIEVFNMVLSVPYLRVRQGVWQLGTRDVIEQAR